MEKETELEIEEEHINIGEWDDVQELFDHYISKKIIVHKKITPAMKRAIKARLRDYTVHSTAKGGF